MTLTPKPLATLLVVSLSLLGSQALAADLVGRWVTTVEGEQLVLTLGEGGGGDLEGSPISWRAEGDTLTLIIGGESERGQVSGTRLQIGGFEFSRPGAAVTTGTEPKAAAPTKGRRVSVPELGVSFVLPEGWSAGWQSQGTGRLYVLQPASVAANEAHLALASVPLSNSDQARAPGELLSMMGTRLGQSLMARGAASSFEAVGEASSISSPAGQAWRRLYAVTVPGRGKAEVYVAGLTRGAWGYTLQGNWATAHATKLRKGADAVLSSLEVQAPAQNAGLSQNLLGCWTHSAGTTDATSYDRSSERWVFSADGRYRMESSSVISGEFGSARSGDSQQGRWSTSGSQLLLQPDGAEPFAAGLAFQNGMFVVDGRRYRPCR